MEIPQGALEQGNIFTKIILLADFFFFIFLGLAFFNTPVTALFLKHFGNLYLTVIAIGEILVVGLSVPIAWMALFDRLDESFKAKLRIAIVGLIILFSIVLVALPLIYAGNTLGLGILFCLQILLGFSHMADDKYSAIVHLFGFFIIMTMVGIIDTALTGGGSRNFFAQVLGGYMFLKAITSLVKILFGGFSRAINRIFREPR